MTRMTRRTLIIGVGNPLRGDDGAGREALRLLRERLREPLEARSARPALTLIEHGGEGAALMQLWQGAARVILIDAALTGAAPGAVHRLAAHEAPLPALFLARSTHAFGPAEAVEMARALGELPPEMIVYGIEGEQFEPGAGLSERVAAGVQRAVERVLEEISEEI